jgi:hypothetical protein
MNKRQHKKLEKYQKHVLSLVLDKLIGLARRKLDGRN